MHAWKLQSKARFRYVRLITQTVDAAGGSSQFFQISNEYESLVYFSRIREFCNSIDVYSLLRDTFMGDLSVLSACHMTIQYVKILEQMCKEINMYIVRVWYFLQHDFISIVRCTMKGPFSISSDICTFSLNLFWCNLNWNSKKKRKHRESEREKEREWDRNKRQKPVGIQKTFKTAD